jgi:hypothetical protein
MPTRTTPRAAPSGGRFPRPHAHRPPSKRTPTRRTSTTTRFSLRRKPAPRSRTDKALNGLAGLVPGSVLGRKAKPTPGSGTGKGKKAGLALLAGAAGFAIKKRRGPKTEEPVATAPDPVTTTPGPVAPTATNTSAATAPPDPLGPSTPERPSNP